MFLSRFTVSALQGLRNDVHLSPPDHEFRLLKKPDKSTWTGMMDQADLSFAKPQCGWICDETYRYGFPTLVDGDSPLGLNGRPYIRVALNRHLFVPCRSHPKNKGLNTCSLRKRVRDNE